MTATTSTTGPLARIATVVGRLRWWVVAAALLSAVTLAAGIGLLSMAGYLISRSALVDTTATLTLAIVGVRFFAVVRAVGRYLERYVGHFGTFRILTRLRVWCYRGIEPLAPAALVDERSGDLLTRIVDDVETLQDLPLRVLAPPLAARRRGHRGGGPRGARPVARRRGGCLPARERCAAAARLRVASAASPPASSSRRRRSSTPPRWRASPPSPTSSPTAARTSSPAVSVRRPHAAGRPSAASPAPAA